MVVVVTFQSESPEENKSLLGTSLPLPPPLPLPQQLLLLLLPPPLLLVLQLHLLHFFQRDSLLLCCLVPQIPAHIVPKQQTLHLFQLPRGPNLWIEGVRPLQGQPRQTQIINKASLPKCRLQPRC
uniref:Uncharacterized protein n=1 Tax=Rhizophora mucronata TaxID=61149 RepID=A0A2P2QNB6_RHIMU